VTGTPDQPALPRFQDRPDGGLDIDTVYTRCPQCAIVATSTGVDYALTPAGGFDPGRPAAFTCLAGGHRYTTLVADFLPHDARCRCVRCQIWFAVPAAADQVVCPSCRLYQDGPFLHPDDTRRGVLDDVRARYLARIRAIRLAAAGRFGRYDAGSSRSGLRWSVESALHDLDSPDQPTEDLQAHLLPLLLAAAKAAAQTARAELYRAGPQRGFEAGSPPIDAEDIAATLVRDCGLGWLLEQAAGADLPPLILFCARYAPRADPQHALSWCDRAQPIPAGAAVVAVVAALADQHLTEPAAATAARRAGVNEAQVTAALTPAGDRPVGGGR
jgi:hypothetical protein